MMRVEPACHLIVHTAMWVHGGRCSRPCILGDDDALSQGVFWDGGAFKERPDDAVALDEWPPRSVEGLRRFEQGAGLLGLVAWHGPAACRRRPRVHAF